MTKPKTKLVEIHLSALTREEFSATVEVPEEFTTEQLDEVVGRLYDHVEGGEFTPDNEFWEKGEGCHHSSEPPTKETPDYCVDEDYDITKPPLPAVPDDFPVQPLADGENPPGKTTCGTCGRSWDDDISTSMTPAPSARCPFEYYH